MLPVTLLLAASAALASASATPGQVHTFRLPGCDASSRLSRSRSWTLAPDTCLAVSTSTSVHIDQAAVCANGTAARLARYEGRHCNGGVVTAPDGLLELSSAPPCVSVRPDSAAADNTAAAYASFGFFCDGIPTRRNEDHSHEPPSPKKGAVSHNACPRPGQPPRAPTFLHPAPDVCMTLPAGQPLKILGAATCADGERRAKLARWNAPDCGGAAHVFPASLTPLSDSELNTCLAVGEDAGQASSYAFWCEGQIVREGNEGGNRFRSGGSVLQFVLLLMLVGGVGLCAMAFALLKWARFAERIAKLMRKDPGPIQL